MAISIPVTIPIGMTISVGVAMPIPVGMPISIAMPRHRSRDGHAPPWHFAILAIAADKQLRHDVEANHQRASQDFVGRILNGFPEVSENPFADKVIGDGD